MYSQILLRSGVQVYWGLTKSKKHFGYDTVD